ncbi:MAG TPA: response regulator transcription factor [Verrucomicrobium sp.]|nr:response regulator transcription factor [Verrucomicrobium sp.]
MKVLAVEDDVVASAVLRSALKSLGHDVVCAEDGIAAWEMFRGSQIRVIVSDWDMPRMDGLEFCRRVRGFGFPEYIYFILLTNTPASSENQELARAAGVDDFLVKPVNPRELLMRLHVAERILGFTAQIQQLEALIPICCYCKDIRRDDGYWEKVEAYISSRTRSQFTHGICPTCYGTRVVPELQALGMAGEDEVSGADLKPAMIQG